MSGSRIIAGVYLDDGVRLKAHASTADGGEVLASVQVRTPDGFKHIVSIYSTDLDALDQLANALHQAAKLGRAEASKTPAHAAAPDSSPEAAGVPPTAAPGEPSFGPEYDCSRPGLHRGPWDGQTCRACGYSAPGEPSAEAVS